MTNLTPTGPRVLLRQLREVMGGAGSAQARLDQAVRVIAVNMVAEVCSVYLGRGNMLELFATEGLNRSAVHKTTLRFGEGLVGLIAETSRPLALSDAQAHANFAYRPETGEEIYHSLMGVPILRGGRVVGVLVVQNRTKRHYSEDELEAMQTIAMVLAEMVSILLAEAPPTSTIGTASVPARLTGLVLNEGLARGVAVLHEPRIVVEHHVADDIDAEKQRLRAALGELRAEIDRLLLTTPADGAESREILEAYRMFANDRGWIARLHDAVETGLTAEAAVERVQVATRGRITEIKDAYLRERLNDLEDLSNRLLRVLTGRTMGQTAQKLPPDAIVVARNMGPAELLDYDQTGLKGLVLEEGSHTSHVAIVARALRIPVIGRVAGILQQVDPGDSIIVDGDSAQVFLRPSDDVARAFALNIELRERREARYAAERDAPAVTRDGVRISLNVNAGLLADLRYVEAAGAEGVGLYRTELNFMVRAALPNIASQTNFYRRVLEMAGDRPVMFRTLDVGGDKLLPYMRWSDEQNPAMGWRAVRLSLDRPALLRMQFRALLKAAAGRELRVMFPMVAEVAEFVAVRRLLHKDIERLRRLGEAVPSALMVGTMLEVPSLAFQLPALLEEVDFVSIGSNDLLQFLFASDRGNPRVADRYDVLSPAALDFLRHIVARCDAAGVPVSLCGEAAGHPLEAMALIGLGLRSISMHAGAIGPVKAMVRTLDAAALQRFMAPLYGSGKHSLREDLLRFVRENDVQV